MIVTSDSDVADRLRILRAHGWLRNVDSSNYDLEGEDIDPRYAFVNWGFNVRPTELQAGFGLQQLKKLPEFTSRRDHLARTFFDAVDALPFLSRPTVHPLANPVWMSLPLMVDSDAPFSRKEFTTYLEEAGVETRPIVTGNVARQPAARLFPDLARRSLPGADAVHDRGFYVGLSPFVTDAMLEQLLGRMQEFIGRFTAAPAHR